MPADEMERLLHIEQLYESETAKLLKLRQLLAQKNQESHVVRRKMDEIPTRTELVQFERRFVELYDQVAALLNETKKYYNRYNTLTDTHKFLTKEISILNSVSEGFRNAMKTEKGGEKFLESLGGISKGVTQNLDKKQEDVNGDKRLRDDLNDKYTRQVEKQRQYFKAVKEFQEECSKNEKLMAAKARAAAG